MDYFPSNRYLKDNNWVSNMTFRWQNESHSATKKNATAVLRNPEGKLQWEKLKISFYKNMRILMCKISQFGGSLTENLQKWLNTFFGKTAPSPHPLTFFPCLQVSSCIISLLLIKSRLWILSCRSSDEGNKLNTKNTQKKQKNKKQEESTHQITSAVNYRKTSAAQD